MSELANSPCYIIELSDKVNKKTWKFLGCCTQKKYLRNYVCYILP
jgi:hypothetical protein